MIKELSIRNMPKDHFDKDLHKTSFTNKDLRQAYFYKSDLRGVDFSGSDLSGAVFIDIKSGIKPLHKFWILFAALLASVLTGYTAMLSGGNIQAMLASEDLKIKVVACATIFVIIVFIGFIYWKGGFNAFVQLVIPVFLFFIVVGGIGYFSQANTTKIMVYGFFALVMVMVMLVMGTIARATTSSLSNILFLIIAVSGAVLGKTMGGFAAALIVAMSCALFSKRALSGGRGFEILRKLGLFFIIRLGTSRSEERRVGKEGR